MESKLHKARNAENPLQLAEDPSKQIDKLYDELYPVLMRCVICEFKDAFTLEDRDELVTDVIIDLIEHPTQYDHRKSSLATYAKVCLRGNSMDLLRFRDTREAHMERVGHHARQTSNKATSPDQRLIEEERKYAIRNASAQIAEAIKELPPNLQAVCEAYKIYGKDYARNLAEARGISPNTVAQWWRRARIKLVEATGIDPDILSY